MKFPFFFMTSSLHFLGLQLMELQFAQGPVVRKPINANPGLKLNRGFNFFGLEDFQRLILSCV